LRWLSDLFGHSGHNDKHSDRQECCEQGSEGVVHTTVFVDLDDLVNQPSHQVHPGKGGSK